MDVAVVVPARLRSERLPRKLLLAETGKPLLLHTLERAAELADLLHGQCYCATDSLELAEEAAKICTVYHSDEPAWCGTIRVANLVRRFEDLLRGVDAVVNWQADEPLLRPADAAKAVHSLKRAPVATLVSRVHGEAGPVRAVFRGGWCRDFGRDWWLSEWGHVGLYAFRKDALLELAELPQSERSRCDSLEQLTWLDAGWKVAARAIDRFPGSVNTRREYEAFARSVGPC